MINAIKKALTEKARSPHLALGERGERAALRFLKRREGYRIVATNFRVPLGRGLTGHKLTAEIDIIAYDGDQLVFIEVKTRTSDEFIAPERAVDLRKQRQIARAARRYRQLMKVTDESYRYDVVTVTACDKERAVGDRIEVFRNYFDDSRFSRARFFADFHD
ncbi:MAG TPA: YraN family protein [Blastocatellia bacterium]|nr:YraN family protein [Blastocatellia bacterium]